MKIRRTPRRALLPTIIVLILSILIAALCYIALNSTTQPTEPASTTPVETPSTTEDPPPDTPPRTINIDLVGDVNFADGWGADYADSHGNSAAAAFSPAILDHLKSADIFYANHEFTMSSRGTKLDKYFTFRAKPSKVDYWTQLGVDVVGLANNHAYDYGELAFLDTLDTLKTSDIKYIGAGRNLAEATKPAYFDIDGYRIAFVAADRSQKGSETRAAAAGKNTPGVLFCFDDSLFLQAVKTASENADFVIAIPHWGTESSTELESIQTSLGRKLIDTGADAVIGAHPHVLQGIDFYKGKLIAYSLGNFWFNWEDEQTAILNIKITDGQPSFNIIPALQTGQQVLTSNKIKKEVIAQMRSLSPNVKIDSDGTITTK